MGDVVAMRGQTVAEMLAQMQQMYEAGEVTEIVAAVVGPDREVFTGISIMTVERALFMADKLLQEARDL